MPPAVYMWMVFQLMLMKGKLPVIFLILDIFRPFPGFLNVRLIKKISQSGREFYFCFVDFENSLQSTIAMDTVQNYRFHKNDKSGLKITFANEPKDYKR